MPKKITKKQMVNVEGSMCFWVSNGAVLKNLNDLRDALNNMNDETFTHHVSDEKNDFAKWVEEVLQDSDLAKKLLKSKTTYSMAKAVDTYINKNY
jgi:hypothetical protein